jgi:cytochrome b-561
MRSEAREPEDAMTLMPFQDEQPDDSMDEWRQRMHALQRASLLLAHCFALLSMIMVVVWIRILGGLSWEKGQSSLVFNFHPLLMIAAFNFMTVASLSFRYRGLGTRRLAKMQHGMAWAVAMLCIIVGLIAVFRSHNDKISGYIANLYSLHSWMGIFVGVVYVIQFFAGLLTFGFPSTSLGITPSFKAKMLMAHHFFGPIIYLAIMLTILLGIQEKEGFVGCSYKVDEADLAPWKHIDKIPEACKVSHLLGFLVLFTGVCTSFSLHQLDRVDRREN